MHYYYQSVDKSNQKDFLFRLKSARVTAGLTQSDVARKFKKPQSYVSKIESGERKVEATELKRFSELYKKPIDSFFS